MVVDLPARTRIRVRVACNRVVFAIELTRPLDMGRLAVGVIHCDSHVVSHTSYTTVAFFGNPGLYFDLASFLIEKGWASNCEKNQVRSCPQDSQD